MNESHVSHPLKIQTILALGVIAALFLTGSLGFIYYRAEMGPTPCFILKNSGQIEIQAVHINGRRASGAGSKTERAVHHNIRPADAVHLEVLTTEGRVLEA